MKGLLLKDFYMAGKYCRSFILILAVFLALSCFGNNNTFFVIYPVLIAAMIPVTLIAYDEREKWHIYCETLPYTRAMYVSGKYLIGLIFELAMLLLSAVAQVYRMSAAGGFSLSEFTSFVLIILIIGLLGPALLLPFIFRFGAEKGRIAYYIVIGAICAGGTIFSGRIPEWIRSDWVLVFAALFAVTAYICSWGLSVIMYKKREL